MELRVIRYFLAVSEARSITEGARRLHVSQPSVSRQLHALERELGVTLFERGQGPARLTHAGRRFQMLARDLVRRERMARDFANIHDVGELHLTVIAPFATILRTIAPFTAVRGRQHPIIDTVEERPALVFERVVEAEADLGVTTVAPPVSWKTRKLAAVGVAAHVPPGHALHGRHDVEVRELVRTPLVLMDRTNAARTVFDAAVAAAQVELPSTIEMHSSFTAQAQAAAGRGAAVLTNEPVFGLHPVRIMLNRRQLRVRLFAGWDASHYATDVIEDWVEEFDRWLPNVPDIAQVDDPPVDSSPE